MLCIKKKQRNQIFRTINHLSIYIYQTFYSIRLIHFLDCLHLVSYFHNLYNYEKRKRILDLPYLRRERGGGGTERPPHPCTHSLNL